MESTELFDILISAGLENRCDVDLLYTMRIDETIWKEIWEYSQVHQVWGIIARGMSHVKSEKIPPYIKQKFLTTKNELYYQYYSVFSFTTYVMELLKNKKFFILKGITLNSLYPDPGMRKISDIDLYVKPSEIRVICKILDQHGFQAKKEIWDYHKVYHKKMNDRKLILELHSRPAGRMASARGSEMEIFHIYNSLEREADIYMPEAYPVPALPPAEYALHLLLHMMNHFFGNEFAFCMLCDWTIFWKKKGKDVDEKKFRELLKKSGLEEFAVIMTGICIHHFKLSKESVRWMKDQYRNMQKEEAVYDTVMNRKIYNNRNPMLNVVWEPGVPVIINCVREVHRQMRFRFPRAGCVLIFWPALWITSILVYIYNNRALGRDSLGSVLKKIYKTNDIEILKQAGLTKKEEK